MTDDLDDLASAYLDGVTSPDEAARVAADPALLARVEELRAVREAMGVVPPADPVRREAAIAAALAAFAEDEAETEGVAPAATPLTAIAPRRGPSPKVIRVIGAAAAVALLALLVPLVSQLGSSSDDDTASDSLESTASAIGGNDAEKTGGDAAEVDSQADTSAPTTTAGASIVDLGTFDDIAGLVESVQDADEQGAPEETTTLGAADLACAVPKARAAEADGASAVTGTAKLAGEPVVTLLITAPDGARTLLVLRASDCARLDELQL